MSAKERGAVLVMGGTSFMGKQTVNCLCQAGYSVVCINRGRIYWNEEPSKANPHVRYFLADRNDHKDTSKTVLFASQLHNISSNNPWKCVIDFSAYSWRDVQSVVKPLRNIALRYIFISSDSVYNNTPKQELLSPVCEAGFDLNEQYLAQRSKQGLDKYGYRKLKCQRYLGSMQYLPYICLRLPDVIGPFDNTDRFWGTMHWVANSHHHPISLTQSDRSVKLSFVFSEDIANLIVSLVEKDCRFSAAYNVASDEAVTLEEFLKLIADALRLTSLSLLDSNKKSSNNYYPSVSIGQIVSQKAKKEIGWQPTCLPIAIQKSVDFFLRIGDQYTQKAEMMKSFNKKVGIAFTTKSSD